MTPTYKHQMMVAGIMSDWLSQIEGGIRKESRRLRHAARMVSVWAVAAIIGFSAETAILAYALSGLTVNVLGHETSGMAFVSVVPMAFAYYHIRIHDYGDEGLRRLFTSWSRVGLVLMVVATSGLIGVSFIVGALNSLLDAVGGGGNALTGSNGNQAIEDASDYAGWESTIDFLAGLPMILFGIALIFSLIITMSVVSWLVGQALLALNIVMTTVDRSDELPLLGQVRGRLDAFKASARDERKARLRLPTDEDLAFARLYFEHVLRGLNRFRAAAMMAFGPYESINPLIFQGGRDDVDLMKSMFESHGEAVTHLNELQDHARPHHTLQILAANPAAPKHP